MTVLKEGQMSKSIFIKAIMCICMIAITAQISWGDIYDQFTFSSIDFDTSIILAPDTNYYVRVNCNLSKQTKIDGIGDPELPTFIYQYSLPSGNMIDSVNITNSTISLLADISNLVYPVQEDAAICFDCTPPPFVGPGAWYDSSTFALKSKTVGVASKHSFASGMSMGSIYIHPLYYDIDSSKIKIYTSMSVTIFTSSTGLSPRPCSERATFLQEELVENLKSMVENPLDVSGNLPVVTTYSYNHPTDPDDVPPNFLIITTEAFAYETSFFKNYKSQYGEKAEIITVEDITGQDGYPGRDVPEKIRNCIIDKYDEGIMYVLLAGDYYNIPMRFVYTSNRSSDPSVGDSISVLVPSDLYYACLEGTWDDGDNDDRFAEPVDIAEPSFDLTADLYVGRVAIRDTSHFSIWVEKYINYLQAPGGPSAGYLTKVLMATADEGVSSRKHEYMASHYPNWFSVDITTLEEDPYNDDCVGQPSGEMVIAELSDPTCQFYYGNCHGSPDFYATCTDGYNERANMGVTTRPSIQGDGWGHVWDIENEYREYLHWSISCYLGALDCEERGQWGWYGPAFAQDELRYYGGAFAGSYNTRVGYWGRSCDLEVARLDRLFDDETNHEIGKSHYDCKNTIVLSSQGARKVFFGNTLFGDPQCQIYHYSDPRGFALEMPSSVSIYDVDTVTIRAKNSSTSANVPDAFITLSKGNEVYERGKTDITGRTYPVLDPTSLGYIRVVCSKAGYILFVDSIEVTPYCADAVAGDANGDGYVIGSDVTFLTNYFRGFVTPPDSCMCPTNFLYHAADANGDCLLIGSDVTYLVNFLGGGSAPQFCTNCPTGGALLGNKHVIPTMPVISKTKTSYIIERKSMELNDSEQSSKSPADKK